ncbi:MAG: 3-deoxy-7-phosphoheptulonate synthase [Deltaproteobacteria bacterium]|nr:3-deoxy-7-phosphoheptulonate synthase [Deltaproteobacteria bacterium]
MSTNKLRNINVLSHEDLITPEALRDLVPLSPKAEATVLYCRDKLEKILDGKDSRLFVVVGPCSIHDTQAALDYAKKLAALSQKVKDTLLLIMRVYFEKPRTTVGWKGLINDPYMNDSFSIEEGLKISRQLLVQLNEMGLPTSTEALDPVIPQYLGDLISWTAIGARTTESQTHREMSSGLSTPVGFKNGTDGNIQVAINAMKSCLAPHSFLGISSQGKISVYKTRGNAYSHVVLRGGKDPNYDAQSVASCLKELKEAGLREKIMIDCSHGNSQKDHNKQAEVFHSGLEQILAGNKAICGFMIESNLEAGNQKIPKDLKQLQYGVSVTDACIDWTSTEKLILEAHEKLKSKK